MGLILTYMMFNIFIPTQNRTLPHTYKPTISLSIVILFHMVVSSLIESHFHPRVFPWWPLEPIFSRYLHHRSTNKVLWRHCVNQSLIIWRLWIGRSCKRGLRQPYAYVWQQGSLSRDGVGISVGGMEEIGE